MTFHDSVSGRPLFTAPRGPGRDFAAFEAESKAHGWPSFRDAEVNWDFVRCLPDGECVSVDGTHLGHNLPDRSGNRCAAAACALSLSLRARWRAPHSDADARAAHAPHVLVSVAGNAPEESAPAAGEGPRDRRRRATARSREKRPKP